jgi:hypothetical protein
VLLRRAEEGREEGGEDRGRRSGAEEFCGSERSAAKTSKIVSRHAPTATCEEKGGQRLSKASSAFRMPAIDVS